MGHLTLGRIPNTKPWRHVVDLLSDGAADQAVLAAGAAAAERDLVRATDSPVFVEAVRLLLGIPLAARATSFHEALRDLGLDIRRAPVLLDLVAAASARLDDVALASRRRTDFDDLAGRALTTTLSNLIGSGLPGLFDATPEDVQAVARKLSWSKGIAAVSRTFFADLVSQSLSHWLDRTLDTHIGRDRRFETVADRTGFDIGLAAYAYEATRIIQEFSGGWYGKTVHDKGQVSAHDAAAFGAVALKKIVAELRRKRGEDD